MLLKGAVALGAGVTVIILGIGLLSLSSLWAALLGGLLATLAALGIMHLTVLPRLDRMNRALARIEDMVAADTSTSDLGQRGVEERLRHPELSDRLERAASQVELRLDRLKKVESYRREFLGDVSHELQTPIFAVQGFAETLLDGALEDSRVNRSFVEKILRHAERLSNLVSDLSAISQIETGSLKMHMEPFDPRSLLNEVQESMEVSADSAGIELQCFVSRDVHGVVGDRERLRQVLENLISNGIKYNEPGGRVETTVRLTVGGSILVSVTDDGIGMGPEHFERVTERFYRVDKSRSRQRGGTGLGLAIVKHILEAHGSKLRLNSRVGHGSTFSFELAAAPMAEKPDIPSSVDD